MLKKFISTILLISLLMPQISVFADVVITKSGNTYRGVIVSISPENIEIKTQDGIFKFKKEHIQDINIETGFTGISTLNTNIQPETQTNVVTSPSNTNIKLEFKKDTTISNMNIQPADELYKHKWIGNIKIPQQPDVFFSLQPDNQGVLATINSDSAYVKNLKIDNDSISFVTSLNDTLNTFIGKINNTIEGSIYKNNVVIGSWALNQTEMSTSVMPQRQVINIPPQTGFTDTKNTDLIEKDTSIPVSFKYTVHGNQVEEGDKLVLLINEDVYTENNHIVFKKGSEGIAIVEKSSKNGCFGKGGKLAIENAKIKDVYGNEHSALLGARSKGQGSASAKILPIVSLAVLWPLVFFGFKKGKEAIIPEGKIFTAFIRADKEIDLTKND